MINFGFVRPGTVLRIPINTTAAATGAPSALSNFAVGDILVYKGGSTTERASTSGYTATTSFDSLTGINEAVIDLGNNADAGFFAAGSNYTCVIGPVTVDGQTVYATVATWTIGYPQAIVNTTIATLASQTSFTLTAGPAEDDALNGMSCIIHDVASGVQLGWAQILDYTGSTRTVTLAAGTTFTVSATDNFSAVALMPLQPATLGRTLVVSAGGVADSNLAQWLGVAPNALQSGQVQALTNLIRANTAVAGAASSITLDAGASAVTDFHKGNMLTILSGTGSGQTRVVTAYNGSTKVATIGAAWATNPDNTSVFAVLGLRSALLGADGQVLISTDTQDLSGTLSVNAKNVGGAAASAATVGTVTNLTNAPTAGDLTAAMKASVTTAATSSTPALSAGGVQAIWDAATSALTAAGSIGKRLVDLFAGISVLAQWLGMLAGKQAPNSTAQTEIRATGGGSGTFDATTDSGEAIRDNVALAATALSTAQWTNARAGYLDILNGLRVKKNTALNNFLFFMVLASDHVTPAIGLTITATRTLDGAAAAGCANAAAEVGAGYYRINFADTDLNANFVGLLFAAATADSRAIVIVTEP